MPTLVSEAPARRPRSGGIFTSDPHIPIVVFGHCISFTPSLRLLKCHPDDDKDQDTTALDSVDDMLGGLGAALTAALKQRQEAAPGGLPVARRLPEPAPGTRYLSDPLVATAARGTHGSRGQRISTAAALDQMSGASSLPQVGDRSEGEQCLFAACAAGEEEVIRVVLSVYVRRGRLPGPGEVLFCTADTTEEDLELAVRRFANRRARSHQEEWATTKAIGDGSTAATDGRLGNSDDVIFIIADVHRLAYSGQAVLLGYLRSHVLDLVVACSDDDGGGGGITLYVHDRCFLFLLPRSRLSLTLSFREQSTH